MAINMVKKQSYGIEKQILVAPELAFTIPVTVSEQSTSVTVDGKKVVKAGTPVSATEGVLINRNTPVTAQTAMSAGVDGVLLHDVYIEEDNNGTIVVFGFVDLDKLDTDVQALYAAYDNSGKVTAIRSK